MNDITELAQREKFEAWAEEVGALPWGILKKHRNQDGSYPGPHYTYMWKAWQAASAELVEALELKEEQRANWFQMAQKLGEDLDAAEKRIAELESFRTAYMEWSDKTDWVQTDKRFYVVKPLGKHRADVLKAYIEHLESRTVKLSKRSVGEVMHMSGFSRDYAEGWCSGNDNGINEIRAAGIKVIEGEQKNG